MQITVKNPGKALGFQVHLRVTNAAGEDLLPILFEDNYFPLFPGEERTITARFDSRLASGAPNVVVEGWNVQPATIHARKLNNGQSATAAVLR
jgi:hypothetical protein